MNNLVENNMIQEMICGNNIAYILQDNSQFLPVEYKVLQSQADRGFLKCMKMLYNGKTEFYYLLDGYKSFQSMIPTLDEDGFMAIMSNLFNTVLEIKNNGFLKCCNTNLSFDRIYVEPNTFKVGLIYLPADLHFYQDDYAFENELKTNLIKLISTHENFDTIRINQFSTDLSDGMLTIQDHAQRLKGSTRPPKPEPKSERLTLVSMNAPTRISIDVNKDEYVLGKSKDKADYAIVFNKMISRSHCKVNKTESGYTVTDLQSTNGTFVNKKRLVPRVPQKIKNGDVVRLANSDFQVIIK